MQLHLVLQGQEIALPIAYRHTLQGLIYRAVSSPRRTRGISPRSYATPGANGRACRGEDAPFALEIAPAPGNAGREGHLCLDQ